MSIAIGFGTIPLSLLTRFVARTCFGINVPQEGSDQVDMDIGYGAVVKDADSASEPPSEDLGKKGNAGKEVELTKL